MAQGLSGARQGPYTWVLLFFEGSCSFKIERLIEVLCIAFHMDLFSYLLIYFLP
jgi:hypothetical protein